MRSISKRKNVLEVKKNYRPIGNFNHDNHYAWDYRILQTNSFENYKYHTMYSINVNNPYKLGYARFMKQPFQGLFFFLNTLHNL